jgi:rhodanese-related sulfurtransferase
MRRVLVAVAVLLAVGAALSGRSRSGATIDVRALASDIEHEADHVTAIELAEWVRGRKAGLRVIDVRGDSEYQAFHIPSAERIPLTSISQLTPNDKETLVLYSEGGAHAAQAWVLLRASGHRNVFFLRGGLLDWMDDVLNPVIPVNADSSAQHRAALSRYFGGVPRSGVDSTSRASNAGAAVARTKRRGC